MTNEKGLFEEAEVISTYTLEEAIEDGVLAKVGFCGRYPVIFTSNLLYDGYEDQETRVKLVNKGLEALKKSDPEDTPDMKLRVLEKDKIWVIADTQAITFMKPEDY
ncbi:MAG: hypothetical protein LHV68_05150 [Elusimicrobia bacterium]|nr:hypothetical protein [Candidatus Liberimonas magnetica]